jgi:hypothetical protein
VRGLAKRLDRTCNRQRQHGLDIPGIQARLTRQMRRILAHANHISTVRTGVSPVLPLQIFRKNFLRSLHGMMGRVRGRKLT